MPRPAKHTKTMLLDKLAKVFRYYGYDGASMSELSRATGLSKASLYHHFPNGKKEMAEKVLAEEGRRLQQHVLVPFQANKAPLDMLTASLRGVDVFYGGDRPACLMNSLLHGTGISAFQDSIAATVAAWQGRYAESYTLLSGNAMEGEAWAAYAIERIQGALVMCGLVGTRAPLKRCLDELAGDAAVYG